MGKVSINGEPSHKRFDMRTYISAKSREERYWWQMRKKVQAILKRVSPPNEAK
jgi:hypothetical protein